MAEIVDAQVAQASIVTGLLPAVLYADEGFADLGIRDEPRSRSSKPSDEADAPLTYTASCAKCSSDGHWPKPCNRVQSKSYSSKADG